MKAGSGRESAPGSGQCGNPGQRLCSVTSRILTPELLDSLAPEHPDARQSRRDLRWVNALMGNHRWLLRVVPPRVRPGERALEIGAGTGELALGLTVRGRPTDALDRGPRPEKWPVACAWHEADARTFERYGDYAAVCGSLVFHHFSDGELGCLGERLAAGVRVVAASEPVRRRLSQRLFAVVGRCLRANSVTLHDAHVSIAAGFQGDELPHLLGLRSAEWEWRCSTTWVGAYRMLAWRRE